MKRFGTVVLVAAAALAIGCGNVDEKGAGIEGGSGDATVDITGGQGSNGTTTDPDDDKTDPPVVTSNSTTEPAFGESSIATVDFFEFPSGPGSITRVIIAEQPDICSSVPQTCDAMPTGEGQALTFALIAGSELATGRYEVGEFDEESATPDTRVATGRLSSLSNETAFEITSGAVDVVTHQDGVVVGTFELEANGQVFVGDFRTESCPAYDALDEC